MDKMQVIVQYCCPMYIHAVFKLLRGKPSICFKWTWQIIHQLIATTHKHHIIVHNTQAIVEHILLRFLGNWKSWLAHILFIAKHSVSCCKTTWRYTCNIFFYYLNIFLKHDIYSWSGSTRWKRAIWQWGILEGFVGNRQHALNVCSRLSLGAVGSPKAEMIMNPNIKRPFAIIVMNQYLFLNDKHIDRLMVLSWPQPMQEHVMFMLSYLIGWDLVHLQNVC